MLSNATTVRRVLAQENSGAFRADSTSAILTELAAQVLDLQFDTAVKGAVCGPRAHEALAVIVSMTAELVERDLHQRPVRLAQKVG